MSRMTFEMLSRHKNRPALRAFMIIFLLICIFSIDTITDFEIAFAVFYIAVILIAIGFLSTRGVMVLAGGCIAMTVLSLFLTRRGSFEAGLLNCGISVSAIAITAYLGLKTVTAQAAVYEARAQFARMARLSSLGELTASIAHEVNQPLAAIAANAGACRRWLERDPPNLERALQAVERISEAAARAGEVIVRVRSLAKSEPAHKEALDLNGIIMQAVALVQREIDHHNILVRMDLAGDLPQAFADKIQIQQVIGNLLLNAIEAIEGIPSERRELDISTSTDEQGKIICTVADSGVGMRAGALDHLFDAFWTTKQTGMGIGLTISRAIIEAHGGQIWATSKPYRGATFRFSLPVGTGEEA